MPFIINPSEYKALKAAGKVKLERARGGELGPLRRMTGLQISGPVDVKRPDVAGAVQAELEHRRLAAGKKVTRDFRAQLLDELRRAGF